MVQTEYDRLCHELEQIPAVAALKLAVQSRHYLVASAICVVSPVAAAAVDRLQHAERREIECCALVADLFGIPGDVRQAIQQVCDRYGISWLEFRIFLAAGQITRADFGGIADNERVI